MKSYLIPIPLLVLALTGCPDKPRPQDTPTPDSPTLEQRAENVADKTEAVARDTKDALQAKLNEWNLTPTDIEADLAKTGRVVRNKTLAAGEKVGGALDNTRLVAVINGKYVADRELSALKIDVDAKDSVVTLKGSVSSLELAGRAVALALDTSGVTQVVGLLTIASDRADQPDDDTPNPM